jgi:lipopolysaccharide/colanic/teichoic acid biosynthesis glycosyltransferase
MPNIRGIFSKGTKRNISPSPLLLSPRDMEHAIVKERMRCDRHAQYFSLVVLQVNRAPDLSVSKQIRILARLLHKRLRMTDEKGMLLKGGVGVLLPMTDLHGANTVRNWILETSDDYGLSIEADVFSYSGSDDFDRDRDDVEPLDGSDSRMDLDESVIEGTVNERGLMSKALAVEKQTKVVRADDMSQVRAVRSVPIHATSTVPSEHFCVKYPAWKRCSDITGAIVGLTLAAPVIAAAGLAIKLTSKGPIFFTQMRTGQLGNAFPIYKLRTMVVDAEELKAKLQELNERDGPAFKMKNDPRVTSIGKFLRKTGVDELPQLWNVLVGHMALVGPRPLPCSEDAKCAAWQRRRLDTKPGLTCTWQISKSRKVSFDDWMRMDLSYARKRSIKSDVGLLVKTVMAVVLGRVGQ